MALFETMRAYSGKVFLLEAHIGRLAQSARELGINVDSGKLRAAVEATMHANQLRDARIRLTVSAGEGETAPDPATCRRPIVLVVSRPYVPYPQAIYDSGYRAIVSSFRRNSLSPLSRMKTANYLESLLARQEARKAGVDESICLNEKGHVAEASMSNIFMVSGENLSTPSLHSGILPGITRSVVLELAARLNIRAFERDITPGELFSADEAFVTNSLIEVMPLTVIDGNRVGSGVPGPLTCRLMAAYREMVGSEKNAP
jgi:branched-subunit amino acid aminotransferase/4-amino-4-deoxychorismate lyase